MPTKSEAAEALYRAAVNWSNERANHCVSALTAVWLDTAIAVYSTATPDAVPPEVQRVVEAAEAFVAFCWTDDEPLSSAAPRSNELVAAVRAYRSSQPEPLSARLAKLKPGSVVEIFGEHFVVCVNDVHIEYLIVRRDEAGCPPRAAAYNYRHITAIISESL